MKTEGPPRREHCTASCANTTCADTTSTTIQYDFSVYSPGSWGCRSTSVKDLVKWPMTKSRDALQSPRTAITILLDYSITDSFPRRAADWPQSSNPSICNPSLCSPSMCNPCVCTYLQNLVIAFLQLIFFLHASTTCARLISVGAEFLDGLGWVCDCDDPPWPVG